MNTRTSSKKNENPCELLSNEGISEIKQITASAQKLENLLAVIKFTEKTLKEKGKTKDNVSENGPAPTSLSQLYFTGNY